MKTSTRTLWPLLLCLLAVTFPVFAQSTLPFSGTSFNDQNGNPIVSGLVTVQQTDSAQTPIGDPVTGTIQNGALPYPLQIPQTDGGFFTITVTDSQSSATYLNAPLTPISNTIQWSFDNFTVSPTQVISGLGNPRLRCAPGAQYQRTDTPSAKPWICSRIPDGTLAWTQSPSFSASCSGGLAMVQPRLGDAYCIAPASVYLLPGETLANPTAAPGPAIATPNNSTGGTGTPTIAATGVLKGNGTSNPVTSAGPADVIASLNAAGQILANAGGGVSLQYLAVQSRKQYDCADPQFAGGMNGSTPDAAAHACVHQAACDHALGVSASQEIIFPSGIYGLATELVFPPQSDVHSSTQYQYGGGTIFYDNDPGHNITLLGAHYDFGAGSSAHPLVCNGTTVTGGIGADDVHFHGLTLQGNPSGGTGEKGIVADGTHDLVEHIRCDQTGGGLGGQCIQLQGVAGHYNDIFGTGLHAYTERGQATVTGPMGVVEASASDGSSSGWSEVFTGEAQMHTGNTLGACNDNCAAFLVGSNFHGTGLFAERSSPGILTTLGAANIDVTSSRVDFPSKEAVTDNGGPNNHFAVTVIGPCLDGTITGCPGAGIANSLAGGNRYDFTISGASGFGTSHYAYLGRDLTVNSLNRNVWHFQGQQVPDANTPSGVRALDFQYGGGATLEISDDAPWSVLNTTTTPNVGLKRNLILNGSISGFAGGVMGQQVKVTANAANISVTSGGNIFPCNGQGSMPVPVNQSMSFVAGGGDPFNGLRWYPENCYPGANPSEKLNGYGVTYPEVLGSLGNMVAGQVPNPPAPSVTSGANSGSPDAGSATYRVAHQIGTGWAFAPSVSVSVAPDSHDYINVYPAAPYYGTERWVLYRTTNTNSLTNCAIAQNTTGAGFNDTGLACLSDGTLPTLAQAVAAVNTTGSLDAQFQYKINGSPGTAGQTMCSGGGVAADYWCTGGAGSPGQAATVAVDTPDTGAPGSSASVTNTGTSNAAVFHFVIPQGPVGPTGPAGPPGSGGTGGSTPLTGSSSTAMSAIGPFSVNHIAVFDSANNVLDGGVGCLPGNCTFTALPVLPAGTPTGSQAASAQYVQTQLATIVLPATQAAATGNCFNAYNSTTKTFGGTPCGNAVPAPSFAPGGGTYTSAQSVTVSGSGTLQTCITTTSSDCVPSTAYSSPVLISATERLCATATLSGSTSPATCQLYNINYPAPAAPVFTPSGGSYTGTQSVAISTATGGASLTTCITTASQCTATTPYAGQISVSSSETVCATATANGVSTTACQNYNITIPLPANPTFSVPGSTYSTAQSLTISESTAGVVPNFCVSSGNCTPATAYSSPIQISQSETVCASATNAGGTTTPICQAYVISSGATSILYHGDNTAIVSSKWQDNCGAGCTAGNSGTSGTPVAPLPTITTGLNSGGAGTGVANAVAHFTLNTAANGSETSILYDPKSPGIGENNNGGSALWYMRDAWAKIIESNPQHSNTLEFDIGMTDSATSVAEMFGTQCAYTNGAYHIDYDNWGGWVHTNIPCGVLHDGSYHHIVQGVHREATNTANCVENPKDPNPGAPIACIVFDYITIDNVRYKYSDYPYTGSSNGNLNPKNAPYSLPQQQRSWGNWTWGQWQIDTYNTANSFDLWVDTDLLYVCTGGPCDGSSTTSGGSGDLDNFNFDGTNPTSGLTAIGSPTLSTTSPHSAPDSAHFATGNNGYIDPINTTAGGANTNTFYSRQYVRINSLPGSGTGAACDFLRLMNGATPLVSFYFGPTGAVQYYVAAGGGVTFTPTSATLSTGNWHLLETYTKIDGTTGHVTVKIDGTTYDNTTLTNTGTALIDTVQFGQVNNSTTPATGWDTNQDDIGFDDTTWLGAP